MVSPRDGEIPGKVAIIQGSPDGGDEHLLSSAVLGVNEAILAINTVNDLKVVLVSPICQPFKDQFASDAQDISGLQIVEGMPESVERAEDGSPLTVAYSQNGDSRKDDFDMVVVLTKSKISLEVAALGKKFEREIL